MDNSNIKWFKPLCTPSLCDVAFPILQLQIVGHFSLHGSRYNGLYNTFTSISCTKDDARHPKILKFGAESVRYRWSYPCLRLHTCWSVREQYNDSYP